jgi:alcohol dehydrogenase (cytochrome c)
MTKPLADEDQLFGDLSGEISALKLVNTNTVKNLSLKWVASLTTGCGPTEPPGRCRCGGGRGGRGRGGRGVGAAPRPRCWRPGNGDANNATRRVSVAAFLVDGVIYASAPDNVYAIDARDGAPRGLLLEDARRHQPADARSAWAQLHLFRTPRRLGVLTLRPQRDLATRSRRSISSISSNAPMIIGDHVLSAPATTSTRPRS